MCKSETISCLFISCSPFIFQSNCLVPKKPVVRPPGRLGFGSISTPGGQHASSSCQTRKVAKSCALPLRRLLPVPGCPGRAAESRSRTVLRSLSLPVMTGGPGGRGVTGRGPGVLQAARGLFGGITGGPEGGHDPYRYCHPRVGLSSRRRTDIRGIKWPMDSHTSEVVKISNVQKRSQLITLLFKGFKPELCP